MIFNWPDLLVFILFFMVVVGVSLYKSRIEKTSEDFFLAGRGLPWWMIGFSLIAANISTEQFVGMNGSAAGNVGFAIASYDWIAAITMVFVAFYFLPRFLRIGIYTIPEYLEYRYNTTARSIMAFYIMVVYVGVTISAVLYSGGLTLHTIFGLEMKTSVWLIAGIAALYTTWGGLKAIAWADLFQGSALILGGFIVLIFGLIAVGGVDSFTLHNQDKMHMFLEADHPELPWTAMLLGIWIPNLYYWGLNQYISQRSLAARSLRHGQLGVLMAAGIQVVLPLIIVIPGIIAWQLYGDKMSTADAAFPMLIRNLIPGGLKGFILAAMAGAVISSLSSMLNSASTIFTMDLYKRHFRPRASSKKLILTGRLATLVFVIIGGLIAPELGDPRFKGIFHFIQDFQGYISPGILGAFLFGMIFRKAPPASGVAGLLTSVPVYALLHISYFDSIAFLNKMAITFVAVWLMMGIITWLNPLKTPVTFPVKADFDMRLSPAVKWLGYAIVFIIVILYVVLF